MFTQLGLKPGLGCWRKAFEAALAWQALRDIGCHQGLGFFSSRPLEYTSGIVAYSDRHCGSSWSKLLPCCPLRTRQTENPSISLRKHVDESNA